MIFYAGLHQQINRPGYSIVPYVKFSVKVMQDVKLHSYLPSALGGGEWSNSLPGHFAAGVWATGAHWLWSWVGLGPSVDVLEERKVCPWGKRRAILLSSSWSLDTTLYWLCYLRLFPKMLIICQLIKIYENNAFILVVSQTHAPPTQHSIFLKHKKLGDIFDVTHSDFK
jgi:hypothetical protein